MPPILPNGRRPIRLSLIRAFDLIVDGISIELPTPAQRLLAFIGMQERPVRRVHVAGVLWLDSTEERASGSLRSALWRIRRAADGVVEAIHRELRLAPNVAVDVGETIAWAHRIADPARPLEESDLRAAFTRGELLPDWYDEWLLVERERLRELRQHALEQLTQRLISAARYADAMEIAQAAVQCDPLRESAHRAVIEVHLAEGNRSEAILHYRSYREILRHEMGLEPSAQEMGLDHRDVALAAP